jgi:hypothetical protein
VGVYKAEREGDYSPTHGRKSSALIPAMAKSHPCTAAARLALQNTLAPHPRSWLKKAVHLSSDLQQKIVHVRKQIIIYKRQEN